MHVDPIGAFLKELERSSGGPEAPQQVKRLLERELSRGLQLPSRFLKAEPGRYARHLLARFPHGATAIVMVWGPGQSTPLHDHAGIWCVEGVVSGRIAVTRFDMLEERPKGLFRFQPVEALKAGKGSAGALIPPVEHHIIANDQPGDSVTLHVYAGEMTECTIFQDTSDGWHQMAVKALSYSSEEPLVG